LKLNGNLVLFNKKNEQGTLFSFSELLGDCVVGHLEKCKPPKTQQRTTCHSDGIEETHLIIIVFLCLALEEVLFIKWTLQHKQVVNV